MHTPYYGFPTPLLASLRCPVDSAPLRCDETSAHILNATLRGSCAHAYEIKDGIVMFKNEQKLEDHLAQEMIVRDTDAETYDAHLRGRYYREIVPTTRAIDDLKNKNVIEYGAGTGRFTEILSHTSDYFLAVDISLESLRVLARKNISDNVGLVCADVTNLPTADNFFDVALALQVIEHIPTLEIRNRFYAQIQKTLGRGGRFVASVYHQDVRRVFRGKPINGTHSNGIPYHFFAVNDFRTELSAFFSHVHAHPIDIVIPFQRRLGFSAHSEGYISRILERVPFLNLFGHLILATGFTDE